MVVLNIATSGCTPQTIVIGRRGTFETMQVVFDLTYLIENYGDGTAVLALKRSQDSSAYPAVAAQDGNTLTWVVSEIDTYYVGAGVCQLMWYVDDGLAKTIIYPMVVMKDILSTSEEPPDGYENWIEHLTDLGAETLQNAQNAAQSASDAETAKDDAVDAKEASEEAARKAEKASVHAPVIQNGYWYIWNDGEYVDTGVRAEGQKGDKGDTGEKGDTGNGISKIEKTGTSGLVDTYTVTYTDGTSTTFTVTNGAKGDKGDTGATGNGIQSITKTGTSGNVDTYTITYTNGQTMTFTVTNGAVTSVAGKTGAVSLDANDVAFSESGTYDDGTVGKELSNQKNAISANEEAIGGLEKDVWASFDYGFTDNVTSGVDYKGYANGKKVEAEIPINETFLLNVETNAFQKYTLYIRRENSQSFLAYGEYNTNAPVTITNSSSSQYKIVELTLWAKAADVTSTGSFAFNVSIDNPDGLAARMSMVETDITEIASEVEDIQAELSGIASYSITDSVTAGSEYKGYINGKKIVVTIPYEMPITFRVNTDCFARYKVYVYTDDTTYYALPDYSNVGEDNHLTAGYMGETYKKITLYIPRINDLTQQNNITSSGTFTFTVSFKEEKEYDIINLNPKSEMLSKIQNGRVSVEVSGRTGANRPKCLTLAHFSDIHADATNLSRIIEFCGEYTDYLDDIVCTGDLVRDHAIADGVEEDFTFWDDCGAENVLSVIGNHDTAAITNGTIDWRGFGQLNTYNKYFAPFIANWNVTQPQNASTVGKCYYYKDYSGYNIRLIVLDCMYYDQAQDDWFASVLESARTSGYAVIVCAHSIGKSGVGINCVFNSLIGDAGPVIVDTSTYIYNANVHTKVDAFISAGGAFICFLGGHFHKDHFGLVSDTVNPQPYILVDTAAYNAPLRDHAVVKFERSQDCFNFVSFDTALHLIKIVRVGYQHDCWMREKNPIAYDYENHTLI